MGCCAGLRNDLSPYKELIVNLGPKDLENYIGNNRNFCNTSPKSEYRKPSSQTVETNAESPIKTKKRKKRHNFHNQRIKDNVKNLKLIAIEEMKNTNEFFVLK